jgi:CO/xanthine dehydrogenase Mo-binding subunit
MSVVGQSIQRVDAIRKVRGSELFPGDISYPDQLFMKILFSGRPHALVRRVDTSVAEAMDGVVAVFTARDVPSNSYGQMVPDQPVLCGPGSDKPNADRVRFIGDQVALVVAEDESTAAEATRRIIVDYDDLTIVTDPEAAMAEGAPLIHPDKGSNIFCHFRIRTGDLQKAFAHAHIVVEEEYHTPAQEHAYLQPEAGTSYVDPDGRLTVVVGGQGAHEDAVQIAHALALPLEQVRVIYPAIGGGFGGKCAITIQIVLALAAWRLHQRHIDRPVKIVWSRDESIKGHCKRHPFLIRAKWAAEKNGKLVAAQMHLIQDAGAYYTISDRVLGNAIQVCTGPYAIPNVSADAYSVYTNNIPGGAFRGFGSTQAIFAAESQMNRLAEALRLDPVELRVRNLLSDGILRPLGSPLPAGVSIGEVVKECAKKAGWSRTKAGWRRPNRKALGIPSAPHLRRGIGFACGFKNVGFSYGYQDECTATIELKGQAEIEEAIVYLLASEIGQGIHTVIIQMAAEALGLSIERVRLVASDTALAPDGGMTAASRSTFMTGNAIRGAVKVALQSWSKEDRPAIGTFTYFAPRTTMFDPETGKSEPSFAYGYVAEVVKLEVDTKTGHIHVLQVICANDVGKAINPRLVDGQIEGAISQAAGHAFLENLCRKDGSVLNSNLSTYLIPTALDVPEEIQSIVLEHADPRGPWGARGVGEMAFLPFTAAALAAVRDATGVTLNEFPATPEKVLLALHDKTSPKRRLGGER